MFFSETQCIYMVSNCCLSLYLNITGIRQGPGKMLLGSWKSPGNFLNQDSGNPGIRFLYDVNSVDNDKVI